jgi:hypothetical protein
LTNCTFFIISAPTYVQRLMLIHQVCVRFPLTNIHIPLHIYPQVFFALLAAAPADFRIAQTPASLPHPCKSFSFPGRPFNRQQPRRSDISHCLGPARASPAQIRCCLKSAHLRAPSAPAFVAPVQPNHKRVYRIYCKEGQKLRRKRPRRRVAAAHRIQRPEVTSINQCWSMDFVCDSLFNGRRIRALTVVDNFSRECLAIHVGQAITGDEVVAVMAALKRFSGRFPERIQMDNGSEFISKAMDKGPMKMMWCWISHGLESQLIMHSLSLSTAVSGMSA